MLVVINLVLSYLFLVLFHSFKIDLFIAILPLFFALIVTPLKILTALLDLLFISFLIFITLITASKIIFFLVNHWTEDQQTRIKHLR